MSYLASVTGLDDKETIARTLIDSFGSRAAGVAVATRLDDKGTMARTLIAIDGQPQGVFQLAAAKPLVAADLSPIPRDATIAAAGRLDANAALELLSTQLKKIGGPNDGPVGAAVIGENLKAIRENLGIDVQEDLLKPLGDVWCVYNSPAEGGLLVTGLTGVVQVKDHARLEAALDKLIAFFHDRVEGPAAEGNKGPIKPGPSFSNPARRGS